MTIYIDIYVVGGSVWPGALALNKYTETYIN